MTTDKVRSHLSPHFEVSEMFQSSHESQIQDTCLCNYTDLSAQHYKLRQYNNVTYCLCINHSFLYIPPVAVYTELMNRFHTHNFYIGVSRRLEIASSAFLLALLLSLFLAFSFFLNFSLSCFFLPSPFLVFSLSCFLFFFLSFLLSFLLSLLLAFSLAFLFVFSLIFLPFCCLSFLLSCFLPVLRHMLTSC